jgi:phosphoribosyl 1,2-cyclic phosphodiesterase
MPRPLYGHNTTSFGLAVGEALILVDNGTGAKNVARFALSMGATRGYVLQTHYHKDHTEGIATNPLLMKRDFIEGIYSPRLGTTTLAAPYAREFEVSNWPVSPATFGVEHTFHDFKPGETLSVGGMRFRTFPLPHPGGCVSYRIETERGDVVIATDLEISEPEDQARFAEFVSGAAVLYIDCQFRDAEYRGEVGICGGPALSRVGWGHSTPSMIRATLAKAKVLPKQVLLGHHDPQRTDNDLRAFEDEACAELASVATRGTVTGHPSDLMFVSFAYEDKRVCF